MSCIDATLPALGQHFEQYAAADLRWHALYTYPRHERSVAIELESRSVEVFLPTHVTESRWKDRRVKLQTPVFPGYVFTRIRPAQRRAVLSAPGSVRLLSFNGAPAPIDDREIEAVRLCLERGATMEPRPLFELGDHVRVCGGPLRGLEGRISRCKDERRLLVPITLINQSIAVEVDISLLEPIETINPGRRSPDLLARSGTRA